MENNITGILTATAGCAASAAVTIGVAVADPAATGDALVSSVIIALAALFTGHRMARAEPERREPERREPTIYQDPVQRRIDQTLSMVREGRISAAEGERLIDSLRTHPTERQVPAPPYGTPEGQA